MKTKLFILTICVAFVSLGALAKDVKSLTGNSLTDFGNYVVTVSDEPMMINGEKVKTYDLNYENTNSPVQIGVVNEKNCVSYIVRSDEFEIQYSCKKGVFGVKKVEKKYQTLPQEEMDTKLDKVNYFAQRVICTNKKSEDELLGLIACYFPILINEEYQASF
jgi:hypothetical protein